jgi:hypothetical protein
LQEQQETIEKEYGSALTLQRKLISAWTKRLNII